MTHIKFMGQIDIFTFGLYGTVWKIFVIASTIDITFEQIISYAKYKHVDSQYST